MIANGFEFYQTTRCNQRSADTEAVALGQAISSDYLLYNKRACPGKIQKQKKKNPQQQHFRRQFFRGNFFYRIS